MKETTKIMLRNHAEADKREASECKNLLEQLENQMAFCDKCSDYKYGDKPCACKKFVIEHEDEPYERYATDFQSAAIKWAKYWNQDDGSLINEEEDIEVTDENGETKIFTVGAEPDVYYSANEH